MRALITGIQGFAGGHLAEHLLAQGAEVHGTVGPADASVLPPGAAERVSLHPCDVRDRSACEQAVRETQPDAIFHLAAVAFVPHALKDPLAAFETNVAGTAQLLEAARRHCPTAKIVLISSGEVYGRVEPKALPATETARVQPASFYAATKASAEALAAAYVVEFALHVVILRPFSHIGPRQSAAFVTASFARQLAQIEAAKTDPILTVGNLDAKRDFTDVRDMVRAYALALERCGPGTPYNISSGEVHSIQEVLDVLLSLTKARVIVRQDAALLRPTDTPVFHGDSTKFRQRTGWAPMIPLRQSLADILDYWRGVVSEGRA